MKYITTGNSLIYGLFSSTTWVSQYQKGKTSLDLNEARDDGVLGCNGISWTICKQPAPRSRQITTPTPRHSIFRGRILFLMPSQQCQSTDGTKNKTYCFRKFGLNPSPCKQTRGHSGGEPAGCNRQGLWNVCEF